MERTLAVVPDVLVVDDGSTDSTPAVLDAFGGRVRRLRHAKNQGKGRALRDGFACLEEAGFSHAVTVDADGQHFPEDVPQFLRIAGEAPDTLLVGERSMREGGAPFRSRFGLWFSNTALRVVGGARLEDTQCGLRCYPLARVRALELFGERYDFELEVLMAAARAGIPLRAVPVRVTYEPEGGRVSHFRPLRDFGQIAGQVARFVRRRRR